VQLLNRLVDVDDILYGGDGTEYCPLYAYVGKVSILVLSRTSCSFMRAQFVKSIFMCLGFQIYSYVQRSFIAHLISYSFKILFYFKYL
jgi:hypothetical protein